MDPDTAGRAAGPTGPAPPADRLLELVWHRHRQWSVAATSARARLDRWRWCNLALLVTGALAGALAAQTWLDPGPATGAAAVAAVSLGLAGFLQAQALNADETARWTLARAASEALKADTYRYLLRVAPYAQEDRAEQLRAQLEAVRLRASALLADLPDVPVEDRPLPPVETVEDYVRTRAQEQAGWHRDSGARHLRQARRLRLGQLLATAVGFVLSTVSGFTPDWRLSTWTAAATTVAAAVGAHLAATRHQGVAAACAATADQLETLVAGFDDASATPEQQARFVADVERVLAAQNQGWTDLLSPDPGGPTGSGGSPPKT
jgi:hypothetical protein